MGFFDKLTQSPQPGVTAGELGLGMLPLIGIPAMYYKRNQRLKKEDMLREKMFSDPASLDPMGQRVQQRMMARNPGELTTPGFMAANIFKQEAQNNRESPVPGMRNIGNVAEQTATRLAAAGQEEASANFAEYAKKNIPAAWKPSEGETLKPKQDSNTGLWMDPTTGKYLPGQKGVIREVTRREGETEVKGYRASGTDDKGNFIDEGWVGTPSRGTAYTSKTEINNSVNAGLKDSTADGIRQKIDRDLTTVRDLYADVSFMIPKMRSSTTGWGGDLTRFVGKVESFGDWMSTTLAEERNASGEASSDIIRANEGLISDIVRKVVKEDDTLDEALVRATYIRMAYSMAKLLNAGDSGGGRGITDADFKAALRSLGEGTTPQAAAAVLERTLQTAMDSMERQMEQQMPVLESNEYSQNTIAVWKKFKQSYKAPGKPTEAKSGEELQKRLEERRKARGMQ